MNRPSGGNGEIARGASAAALKGAALIGIAVIGGVFLLQRVDTSDTGSASARTTPKTTTTTTVHHSQRTTTTTTKPSTPTKTPDQLKVLVLNGGAPTGAAALMRTTLQGVGYTNQPQASTWTGHTQAGKSVMCRSGLDREAVALSQQSALQGAKIVAFPTPPPPSTDGVDCVVVVGS